jgi:hypothetical protein
MNSSKNAAVLMLVGAFAAGVGSTYAGSVALKSMRDKQPVCPQPRTESEIKYRQNFADQLGLDSTQKAAFFALIDERNRAVSEVFAVPRAQVESIQASTRARVDSIYAVPRARADSIRNATRQKQNAIFTDAQRTKIAERLAEMDRHRAEQKEQQSRCERPDGRQMQQQKNQPPTKNKSNH